MKALTLTIAVCASLAVAGCGGDDDSSPAPESPGATTSESSAEKSKPRVVVPQADPSKKLKVRDLEKGSGAEATPGAEVTVQYVGVGYKSGEEFDASWDRGEPFSFSLGAGEVIPGWDKGVEGMKVGGRRELTIPPGEAYGEAGAPPAIGPNETLVFVIDLLEVN